MMQASEVVRVVRELVGPIHPVGETNTDDLRLWNLDVLIEVVNHLVADIDDVAKYANRTEHSMKHVGVTAKKFLEELKETE